MPTDAAPEITPEMLQQNPVLLYYLLFVGMVIMAMGIGSLASWAWIFYSRANGKSILPMRRPWTPGYWSLLDMAVIATSVIVLQVVLAQMAMQFLDITRDGEISLEAAAAGGLASVFGVGFSVLWIMARYRQSPGHVGFDLLSPKRLGQGVVLGLAALPVVYILMMVVSLVSKTDYEHPLITSATQSGTLSSYLMGFFAAAIAAPIVEEFLFRVILQGWLQALPFKSISTNLVGWPVRLNVDPTSNLDIAAAGSLALPESAAMQIWHKSRRCRPVHLLADQTVSKASCHQIPIHTGQSFPYLPLRWTVQLGSS
jgi:membrane protease YdiL (CAAX protease family)